MIWLTVDIIILAVTLIAMLIGVKRGFLSSLVSFIGLVLAILFSVLISSFLSELIFNGLLRENGSRSDRYFVLKDLRDYIDAQNEVDRVYRDRKEWAKKCLYNLANSGKFSSDRTIGDYAEEIWEIEPNKIDVE